MLFFFMFCRTCTVMGMTIGWLGNGATESTGLPLWSPFCLDFSILIVLARIPCSALWSRRALFLFSSRAYIYFVWRLYFSSLGQGNSKKTNLDDLPGVTRFGWPFRAYGIFLCMRKDNFRFGFLIILNVLVFPVPSYYNYPAYAGCFLPGWVGKWVVALEWT
ncbi:uncharacterized protein BDV17DRAFT_115496 [Aspergillus undulatus]|uniref:uncharacterized protein n=1 Tax=Aspergillus undulatus TaxID=1810928 RepID=UPI003CCCC481